MENRNNNAIFDTNDLKSFLRVVRKNWWIFIGIIGLSAGVAIYYGHILQDVYAIVTEVLLKSEDQSSNTLNSLSSGTQSSAANIILGNTQVENYNEIQVIQSFDLLRSVVDKLDIAVSYYIEGRLNDKEMFSGVPFKINVFYLNSAYYESNIKVKFIDKYHYKLTYANSKKDTTLIGTF